MAFDISKFPPLEKFREAMNSYIQYIKSCPTTNENVTIYMPGEIEYDLREKRLREGIPLPESIINDLAQLCRESGIDSHGLV